MALPALPSCIVLRVGASIFAHGSRAVQAYVGASTSVTMPRQSCLYMLAALRAVMSAAELQEMLGGVLGVELDPSKPGYFTKGKGKGKASRRWRPCFSLGARAPSCAAASSAFWRSNTCARPRPCRPRRRPARGTPSACRGRAGAGPA